MVKLTRRNGRNPVTPYFFLVIMNVKIIEVEHHFWKSTTQTVLRYGKIDLQLIPVKDDVIHLDGNRYRVLQRDFVSWNPQSITLFVSKL